MTHGDHPHFVAVFLAKQRQRPGLDGVIGRHHPGIDGLVQTNNAVNVRLDAIKFIGAHRLGVAEVETQAIRSHQRAFLRDMRPEHAAQRFMQKMGHRMIGAQLGAPVGVDD